MVQIYFKPFDVTSADFHWIWVIIWSVYFAAFYGATAYFIPILAKGFAPRIIICLGLFIYGVTLFFYMVNVHFINFALLAL